MNNMETIIKKLKREKLNKTTIRQAGSILKKGGLVAFPTETVYGLGADALNEKASRIISQITNEKYDYINIEETLKMSVIEDDRIIEGWFDSCWRFPDEIFDSFFEEFKDDTIYMRCLSEEYGCGLISMNVYSEGSWWEPQYFNF